MTQAERVRLLRKELSLTQSDFGKRVDVGKTAISKIEKNENSLTDRMFNSICREFNVNEEWLRYGKGEMFSSPQIGLRIKELRKNLNLTQNNFGNRIGVKANTIGNYELLLRNPSNSVIHSICIEFNVNENWLKSGEGGMFSQNKTSHFTNDFSNNSSKFNSMLLDITTFLNQLNDEQKEALYPIVEEIAKIITKK